MYIYYPPFVATGSYLLFHSFLSEVTLAKLGQMPWIVLDIFQLWYIIGLIIDFNITTIYIFQLDILTINNKNYNYSDRKRKKRSTKERSAHSAISGAISWINAWVQFHLFPPQKKGWGIDGWTPQDGLVFLKKCFMSYFFDLAAGSNLLIYDPPRRSPAILQDSTAYLMPAHFNLILFSTSY